MTHQVCSDPECTETASVAYIWSWGEQGTACPRHQVIRQQQSEQLSQTITFTPLNAGIQPPIERHERLAYNAQILTLEEELSDCKKRGLEMYQSNQKLLDEGRLQFARNGQLKRDLEAKTAELEGAEQTRDRALADLADARDSLDRLSAFIEEAPRSEG